MIRLEIWKFFSLHKLFEINAGRYRAKDEYGYGNVPYISASAINNGISQRINLEADFKGNVIVTGKIGCNAFYQIEDFCATSDVNILKLRNYEMNYKIGLFIVSIINFSENYKWSYGRQCRVGDSNKIVIKLPIETDNLGNIVIDGEKKYSEEGYIPNWNYMEKFIETIEHKKCKTNNSIANSLNTKNMNKNMGGKYKVQEWKEFKLGNIFDQIYKATSHIKAELTYSENPKENFIPFITRTENNNACDCYISLKEAIEIEKGNAIIIGDTTSTIFYQEYDFATGDHIVVCRAKWINKYTALFLKSVLEKERYRYSYGRAFKKELIEDTKIKLPVDEKEELDVIFMENYIKSLPFGDRI